MEVAPALPYVQPQRAARGIMIDLHYWPTPNGHKITLFLEETGLPYRIVPVDIGRGEQFRPEFLAIAPNNRMPAIVDHDPPGGGAPVSLFESGAILLYLAEKTGRFMPAELRGRAEVLQWLFWQMGGLGPMAGQNHHFAHYAPEKLPYAINRYDFEAWRHWNILEAHLAKQPWMVGGRYTLLDMAVWGWARAVPFALGDKAWEQLPNVKRHFDAINARPAVQRVNALRERHTFKAAMDDEAKRAMFPQNERLKTA